MINILKNYFILFLILIVLNIILISTTGNGYFMYLFFYLYGFFALLAFANILFHIGIHHKGSRIYILAFVFLVLIGVFLTYYGGELSSKLLLYNSKRNFPPALEKFVSLGENPISVFLLILTNGLIWKTIQCLRKTNSLLSIGIQDLRKET